MTTANPDVRRRELRAMKRRATGLLALVAIVFGILVAVDEPSGWLGYALAAAEGSLVGGLADWFAVTALFRHPLGLPIPHTAIIRERKEQFGATLGSFVQESFLTPEIIGERVREANVADRVAAWLANAANADTVARAVLEATTTALDVLEDEDVGRFLQTELQRSVDRVQLAPLAGRVLELVTREQRHKEVFDALLRGVITILDEQREPLRERFGEESPCGCRARSRTGCSTASSTGPGCSWRPSSPIPTTIYATRSTLGSPISPRACSTMRRWPSAAVRSHAS